MNWWIAVCLSMDLGGARPNFDAKAGIGRYGSEHYLSVAEYRPLRAHPPAPQSPLVQFLRCE